MASATRAAARGTAELGAGVDHDAVGEYRLGEPLDVVQHDEVASHEQGLRLATFRTRPSNHENASTNQLVDEKDRDTFACHCVGVITTRWLRSL